MEIDLDFFIPENDAYIRTSESFSERAYSHREITEMLNKAKFEVIGYYGDMTFETPQENEQRAIYVARKL